jgi:hypothetical protein
MTKLQEKNILKKISEMPYYPVAEIKNDVIFYKDSNIKIKYYIGLKKISILSVFDVENNKDVSIDIESFVNVENSLIEICSKVLENEK